MTSVRFIFIAALAAYISVFRVLLHLSWNWSLFLALVPITFITLLVKFGLPETSSLYEHSRVGMFHVIYPDGRLSQRFMMKTAFAYKRMFGGNVVFRFSKAAKAARERA